MKSNGMERKSDCGLWFYQKDWKKSQHSPHCSSCTTYQDFRLCVKLNRSNQTLQVTAWKRYKAVKPTAREKRVEFLTKNSNKREENGNDHLAKNTQD